MSPAVATAADARPTRRPVNTCMRCRRLKLKCDHAHPCSSCVRSSMVNQCKYEHDEEGDESQTQASAQTHSVHALLLSGQQSGVSSPDANEAPDAAGETDSPVPKKRRRAVRVCARCRRLKLRCDQGAPCSACAGSGAATDGECVYAARPRDASVVRTEDGVERERELSELQTRIKALEAQLAAPYPSPHSLAQTSPAASSSCEGRRDRDLRDLRDYAPSTSSYRQLHRDPRVPLAYELDMPSILAHLPPASDCRRLIHSFQTFDLLFRLVHMPSFMRKVDALIATIAAVQGSSPPVRSAGFDARRRADSALAPRPEWDTIRMTEIACVLAAMVCGATIYIHGRTSDAPIQHDPEMHDPRSSEHHLRALLDVVLNMCDAKYTQLPPVEYVYAHLLTSYTYMAGIGGGPQRGWLASGRAYHAALLVGINNEDRTDESTFDRELRRRCWWHTINSRATIANRLRIDVPVDTSKVPRPLNLSDADLDLISTQPEAIILPSARKTLTEWSYVDCKLDVLAVWERRDALMARTDIPLLERLKGAHRLIDEYVATVPLHQQGDYSVANNLPSWAQMQARVSDISIAEIYVHLYRPYFGTAGDEVGTYALSRGVRATRHLVQTIKALSQNVLFGWLDLDAPTFALWTCGMRSFTAGLVLAYALMADPNNAAAPALMADFEAMIAIVRSRRAVPHTSQSNEHALITLQQLHKMIKSKDNTVQTLKDPYTGQAVDMPLILPDFAIGEWDQWEALFQELFHDPAAVPSIA